VPGELGTVPVHGHCAPNRATQCLRATEFSNRRARRCHTSSASRSATTGRRPRAARMARASRSVRTTRTRSVLPTGSSRWMWSTIWRSRHVQPALIEHILPYGAVSTKPVLKVACQLHQHPASHALCVARLLTSLVEEGNRFGRCTRWSHGCARRSRALTQPDWPTAWVLTRPASEALQVAVLRLMHGRTPLSRDRPTLMTKTASRHAAQRYFVYI